MSNLNMTMGVDLGQRRDPSAVVVVEGLWHRISEGGEQVQTEAYHPVRGSYTIDHWSGGTERLEHHYHARYIGRLELGTPYPQVVEQVFNVARTFDVEEGLVDATGIGGPVMDMFDQHRREHGRYPRRLRGIVLTGGERSSPGNVAKVDLVGAIHAPLSAKRLHYGGLPLSAKLDQELDDYHVRITERGNDRYGSVTESAHDDLVIAFGLALHAQRRRPTDSARVIEIRQSAAV